MIWLAVFLWVACTSVLPVAAATVGDPVATRSAEGQAHYEAGRYDEALRAYQDALVERPESAALHLNVGAAMYQLGDHENALEEFGRAAASPEAQVATRGFYNKGNTHFELQDYGAAVDAYKQALERTPGDVDAKANLELALRLMQQPPSSQQGESEESDDSEESEDSEQSQEGESQPQEGQPEQQPEDSEAPGQPESEPDQETDQESESEPEPEPESESESESESGEENEQDESEANQDLAQGDESETMDEKEAEQMLDALNDRDEQSQKRLYRARRRGDDTQDW